MKRHFTWTAAAILTAMMFAVYGCGGGGSGSGAATSTALAVSPAEAPPGAFITIEDSSIKSGSDLNVTFSNATGFTLTLRSLPVKDGSARVPVPPYINEETGDIESGNVTISIPGGRQAAFLVKALPELEGSEPGAILKAYLEVSVENYNIFLDILADFEVTYGYDTQGLQAEIQKQIESINSTLNELETTGSLISDFDGLPLLQSDLKKVDQLLYAVSKGIYDEINLVTAQTANNPLNMHASQNSPNAVDTVKAAHRLKPETYLENLAEDSRESTARYDAMNAAWKASARAYGKEYGGEIGEELGDQAFSKWVEPTSVFLRHTVHTGLQEGISVAQGNGVFSEETRKSRWEITKAVDPTGLLSMPEKLADWYRWIQKNVCSKKLSALDYKLTCSGIEKEVSHTDLAYVNFAPQTVQSGKEGTLSFNLDVEVPYTLASKNNAVFIAWGDGNTSQMTMHESSTWWDAFGHWTKAHVYTLPSGVDEKYYTITVTATGDNDLNYHSVLRSRVLVKSEVLPLRAEFTEASSLLKVDEAGFWRVDVTGGVPPFFVSMNWDDGNKSYRHSSSNVYKGPHSYKAAGLYTPTFRIKDTNDDQIIIGALVTVEKEAAADGCVVSPETTAGEGGKYYYVKQIYYPMPDSSSCYTASQIDYYMNNSDYYVAEDTARGSCTICPQGYSHETYNGSATCVRCPDGTVFSGGCCR